MTTNTQTLDNRKIHKETKAKSHSTIYSWIRFLAFLLAIVFIFRYALGIIIIDGNSMNPTLKDNDIIMSSNIFYEQERNDIVIIQNENGFDIIKRIIALPSETVEIKNGIVLVNGNPIEENYTIGMSSDMPKVLVAEDTYFVIGDNRAPGESLDSRSSDIGLISIDQVKGEAFFSILSFKLL